MNNDFLQLRLDTDYPAASAGPAAAGDHDYVGGIDAFSAYSSSSTVGSLAGQSRRASLSSQSSGDPPGFLASTAGIRYITSVPVVQDVSFQPSPAFSIGPIHTSRDSTSTSPSSSASSLAFSPFTNVFQTGLTGSASYQSAASSLYSTAAANYPQAYAMSDIRPRNHPSNSGMPPPSRSPSAQNPVSPSFVVSARDSYSTSTPHVLRHGLPTRDLVSRSPLSTASRGNDAGPATLSSPAGNAYGTPNGSVQLDPTAQLSLTAGGPGPPLQKTSVIHRIHTADGQAIHPEINARIDKGFFLADQDWTCYRRNYFSVACSYSLRPAVGSTPLYLIRSNGPAVTESIQAFAMTIAAVVDGAGGKPVELVQHTPKRDKGPQGRPERVKLNPHSAGSAALFPGTAPLASSLAAGPAGYDPPFSQSTAEQRTVANFERIQFKSATANNGKRRAAQQYYHLIVELFADAGGSWVKVASRISVPMVVRGRSPGHYQDNRRGSSSSAGPGGAGGSDGGGAHPGLSMGPGSGARGMGDAMSLMGGSGSMLGGNGYQTASGLSSLHHSPASLNSHPLSAASSSAEHAENSVDTAMASEASSTMDGSPSYQYYSSPFFDSQVSHLRPPQPGAPHGGPSFPSLDGHVSKVYTGDDGRRGQKDALGTGPSLPPPVVPWPAGAISGRDFPRPNILRTPCGRFVGSDTSRGYYSDLPAL
ncbi:MAG: hypothetical protein M1832_002124 [Thelocarpon impressellum]|nr:MAG: hypothetical protein M1832_002124 [Thelocarpon impressellum]